MTRTFNTLTKIELTETQSDMIDSLISYIIKNDTAKEVEEVVLSLADVTDGVLNTEFCPIVVLNTIFPSDELYESVKENCKLIPEYISKPEQFPARCVTLWKKEA